MNLYIGHMSALRYWRSTNELLALTLKKHTARIRTLARSANSAKQVKAAKPTDYGFLMDEEHPLDILVANQGSRRYSQKIKPHSLPSPVPYDAFYRVNDNILVSSPEFVYLQLASVLNEVELACVGNELCGTYNLRVAETLQKEAEQIDYGSTGSASSKNSKPSSAKTSPTKKDKPDRTDGFDKRLPLTTKAKLTSFVQRASEVRGAAKALRCLQWVADGCASPRETNTLLAMCLPRRLGGYWLPLPKVNPSIPTSSRLKEYVEKDEYKPDFLWEIEKDGERWKVAVEYDSSEWHDGDEDAQKTRIRRNDFETMGYLVTSINKMQLKDADLFERAVRQVIRDLGYWRPASNSIDKTRHQGLLDKLFDIDVR